ncbi:hypothetical protein SLUN_13400 [Streptomyces lunaelactis]|uniref:Gram-positive cocci surface proteins LPxTG domain-containing protein n=1 Tax=Streptomyces lunaelactis TaxID=1535768 RepID=A0A2R4T1W2_9ACTN|nr:hypothetical protein SLUN_13400 [Streptomyces lunaelactis]NUK26395.1 hypothetical protein [Streptomyces lunaelactis]NUK54914.1 hypothetical protein [Streptomyces lunaelactis]NUK68513.1 hypothetical protein [Streptomyces lunaelactis]NUK75376.1 hypothetical protein [Streptomyces lunaelactis]
MHGKRSGSLSRSVSGSIVAAIAVGVLILPSSAYADHPEPGSSQGGTPGPAAPADVRITTELPGKITVDNTTEKTTVTATVANGGTKDSGPVTLSVVGFDGMKITAVEGCVPIPEGRLPQGSNSGYACVIDNIAAGKHRSYEVAATFDLQKTGKICLPVTEGTSEKLIWQQGPVPFGTSQPTPNAPDTPLLLGTDNVPFGPEKPPAADDLPRTGPAGSTLPLALAALALFALGGTGIWWTTRRAGRP